MPFFNPGQNTAVVCIQHVPEQCIRLYTYNHDSDENGLGPDSRQGGRDDCYTYSNICVQ